jgi:hypothetical protein
MRRAGPRGAGSHSLLRTQVAEPYRKTWNLRAVQLLPGHAKIETTVPYLGAEVDDAPRLAEQIESRSGAEPKVGFAPKAGTRPFMKKNAQARLS